MERTPAMTIEDLERDLILYIDAMRQWEASGANPDERPKDVEFTAQALLDLIRRVHVAGGGAMGVFA